MPQIEEFASGDRKTSKFDGTGFIWNNLFQIGVFT
jgi:hypothetical protein